jgi:hypothetical protein
MNPTHVKILTAAALASTVLTACTANVRGTAQGSAASVTSVADASNPLKNLSPCTTLDQVVTGQGFAPAVPTVADAQHSCRVHKDTQGNTEGVDISLSLQDGRSYKDNIRNPKMASPGTVGARSAIEEAEPIGAKGDCDVSIEVKPNSRAIVGVSSGDTDQACKLAESLAEKLEPLLPKST